MNQSRETIYNALLELLRSAAPFVVASRRLKMWDSGPYPALYIDEGPEEVSSPRGYGAAAYRLMVDVWIYAVPDPSDNVSSYSTINPLIDAVQNALSPVPIGPQTLGGLVEDCRIEGTIQKEPIPNGGPTIAKIPVVITTGN